MLLFVCVCVQGACACAELANDRVTEQGCRKKRESLAAPAELQARLHPAGVLWKREPKALCWTPQVGGQVMPFPPLGHGSWEEDDPGTGTVPCPLP